MFCIVSRAAVQTSVDKAEETLIKLGNSEFWNSIEAEFSEDKLHNEIDAVVSIMNPLDTTTQETKPVAKQETKPVVEQEAKQVEQETKSVVEIQPSEIKPEVVQSVAGQEITPTEVQQQTSETKSAIEQETQPVVETKQVEQEIQSVVVQETQQAAQATQPVIQEIKAIEMQTSTPPVEFKQPTTQDAQIFVSIPLPEGNNIQSEQLAQPITQQVTESLVGPLLQQADTAQNQQVVELSTAAVLSRATNYSYSRKIFDTMVLCISFLFISTAGIVTVIPIKQI